MRNRWLLLALFPLLLAGGRAVPHGQAAAASPAEVAVAVNDPAEYIVFIVVAGVTHEIRAVADQVVFVEGRLELWFETRLFYAFAPGVWLYIERVT